MYMLFKFLSVWVYELQNCLISLSSEWDILILLWTDLTWNRFKWLCQLWWLCWLDGWINTWKEGEKAEDKRHREKPRESMCCFKEKEKFTEDKTSENFILKTMYKFLAKLNESSLNSVTNND